MQFLSESVKQEIHNLPHELQLVQANLLAITQANAVAPTQANAMADKVSRMVSAFDRDHRREAERLWRELQPEVSHWLEQELPTSSIITGLKR